MCDVLPSGIPAASHHNWGQKEAEIKEVDDEVEEVREVEDPWTDPCKLHVNACCQSHDRIPACYSYMSMHVVYCMYSLDILHLTHLLCKLDPTSLLFLDPYQ